MQRMLFLYADFAKCAVDASGVADVPLGYCQAPGSKKLLTYTFRREKTWSALAQNYRLN